MDDRLVVYSLMVGMLTLGIINTISVKAMDQTNSSGHEFNHPYFQASLMLMGEVLCLAFYFIYLELSQSHNCQSYLNQNFLPKLYIDLCLYLNQSPGQRIILMITNYYTQSPCFSNTFLHTFSFNLSIALITIC